jgi:DNA-binding NarL/FixJ family response regulator
MTSQERREQAEIKQLARIAQISAVRTLSEQGKTNLEIANILEISESSVRLILNPNDNT